MLFKKYTLCPFRASNEEAEEGRTHWRLEAFPFCHAPGVPGLHSEFLYPKQNKTKQTGTATLPWVLILLWFCSHCLMLQLELRAWCTLGKYPPLSPELHVQKCVSLLSHASTSIQEAARESLASRYHTGVHGCETSGHDQGQTLLKWVRFVYFLSGPKERSSHEEKTRQKSISLKGQNQFYKPKYLRQNFSQAL